jgi:diacylglycerol kinase family enzyme/membrane-associated phospholipid phosphatase
MIARHLRRLVPAPVRRADIALYRRVARTRIPVLGRVLPRLSSAANHSVLWMAIAGLLGAAGGRFGRRAALRGMLSVGISSFLTNVPFKLLTGRTRPDIRVVPEARLLPHVPTSTSFPSGHSASALAFATGASLEDPRLRVPLGALGGAVAFSRVYTGVHYPGDVIAGSAIGFALGRATTRLWPLTSTHRATAPLAAPETTPEPDGTGLSVVVNVGAGLAVAPEPVNELRAHLAGARIVETSHGEAFSAVLERSAQTCAALGVAGGDGSASVAAAAAHAAGKPLALFPAGTLNHLAGDLGLDAVSATARAVAEQRVVAMDIAEIDGHPFVNAAAVGGYPELVRRREQLESRIGKWPAAIVSLVRLLWSHDPLEVTIDGRKRRIWMMFIGNCRFDAQGLAPTRRVRLDDGMLDVRLVHADRPWARIGMVLAALTGRIHRSKAYEQHLVRDLHVSAPAGALQLAADGETFEGRQEFRVVKRDPPLLVFQPRRSDVPAS